MPKQYNIQPSTWGLSVFDYQESLRIEIRGAPFYAVLAAAMRRADSENLERLRFMFPIIYTDLERWRNTPGALA